MSNFSDGFDEIDSSWQNAQPAEKKDFENLPDGKYQGAIEGAAMDKWDDGTLYIKYTVRVVGGTHANRCAFKRSSFTNDAMPYIKRDFETIGIDPNRPLKLVIEDLPRIIGTIIDFTVKTSKDKTDKNGIPVINTFFDRIVSAAAPAGARTTPKPAARPASSFNQQPLPVPPPIKPQAFYPIPDDDTALPFDL